MLMGYTGSSGTKHLNSTAAHGHPGGSSSHCACACLTSSLGEDGHFFFRRLRFTKFPVWSLRVLAWFNSVFALAFTLLFWVSMRFLYAANKLLNCVIQRVGHEACTLIPFLRRFAVCRVAGQHRKHVRPPATQLPKKKSSQNDLQPMFIDLPDRGCVVAVMAAAAQPRLLEVSPSGL